MGERLGINVVGATELPRAPRDETRIATFEQLIATARAGDGTVDTAACPVPGARAPDASRRPARVTPARLESHDAGGARAAAGKGPGHRRCTPSSPATTASGRCSTPSSPGIASKASSPRAPTSAGAGSTCSRLFGDPSAPTTWVDGVVYALPPAGFRREWGNEWVSPDSVRPQLRVRVGPTDFPLLDTVVGLTSPIGFRQLVGQLRAAKRRRAATP